MERYLSSGPVRSAIAKRQHHSDDRARRRCGSRLEACPLCGRSFHVTLINSHAAACDGPPTVSDSAARPPGASEPVPPRTAAASNQSCTVSGPPPPTRDVNNPEATQQQAFAASLMPRKRPAPVQHPPHLARQLENPALPGQHLFPNFISESEEAELLAFLDCETTQPPWKPSTVRNSVHRAHGPRAHSALPSLRGTACKPARPVRVVLSVSRPPVHSSTGGISGGVGGLGRNSAVAVALLSRQSALRHHYTLCHRCLLGWRSGCARRYIASILCSFAFRS